MAGCFSCYEPASGRLVYYWNLGKSVKADVIFKLLPLLSVYLGVTSKGLRWNKRALCKENARLRTV